MNGEASLVRKLSGVNLVTIKHGSLVQQTWAFGIWYVVRGAYSPEVFVKKQR